MTLQILLTNDDGILAPGLNVLRRAVEGLGDVTTIAPDHNASAVGRSITIDRALHLVPTTYGDGWQGFACDGTPSDCVRLALLGVEGPAPDLVVSGVNHGANMGADVTYSGTVGAALEAALRGRPAISFSIEVVEAEDHLAEYAPVIRLITEVVIERGLPRHSILNVNLPDRPLAESAGVKATRLGGASCHDRVYLGRDGSELPAAAGVVDTVDPTRGARELFVPCEPPTSADWADTDFEAIAQGYVAVTPLTYDLLDVPLLAHLGEWDFDLARLHG